MTPTPDIKPGQVFDIDYRRTSRGWQLVACVLSSRGPVIGRLMASPSGTASGIYFVPDDEQVLGAATTPAGVSQRLDDDLDSGRIAAEVFAGDDPDLPPLIAQSDGEGGTITSDDVPSLRRVG